MVSLDIILNYILQVLSRQYVSQDLINTLTRYQKMFKGNGILAIETRVAVNLRQHSIHIHRVL